MKEDNISQMDLKGKEEKQEEVKIEEKKEDSKDRPKYDIKKDLTEEEIKKLEEFRQLIKPHLTSEKRIKFVTDITLVRYLRARKWVLDKSEKMLVATLKWRDEFKPEELTADDVKVEMNNNGKMYRNGVDRLQHPIILMKPRHDNTNERIPKVRYLVYLLEKCIVRMEEEYTGNTMLVIVVDFDDYNPLSGVKHTGTNREVLGILQDHYPERLYRAYIVNQGWLMNAFWSVLNPFMDPKTKEKIQMLKPKKTEAKPVEEGGPTIRVFERLMEDIDETNLEVEYGGQNTFKWDYEREYYREENILEKLEKERKGEGKEEGELILKKVGSNKTVDLKAEAKKPPNKQPLAIEQPSQNIEEEEILDKAPSSAHSPVRVTPRRDPSKALFKIKSLRGIDVSEEIDFYKEPSNSPSRLSARSERSTSPAVFSPTKYNARRKPLPEESDKETSPTEISPILEKTSEEPSKEKKEEKDQKGEELKGGTEKEEVKGSSVKGSLVKRYPKSILLLLFLVILACLMSFYL